MPPLPLLDRPAFETALDTATPATLAVMDLDHFKILNDTLGHAEGDRVLRTIERLLTGSLPHGSTVARLGGDEYAALFPDTAPETALILMDEVIRHFHANRDPNWPSTLSLSVGLAARPAHASSPQDLLRAADAALYRAKVEGRNRVAIYVESKMVLKSNYYPRPQLDRLAKLAAALGRTEASLLREALDDLIDRHREAL
ncbi:GGDEF domain-containing protein [Deinococcus maricopensis]|uniref:Diguanylate cyclase n=1 Tax=Deinococcus maricopensis (strain DSM 21211 / LMG 22137 / NRRL B-23946 / LB-34) TaxID=709986 RepID=E8UB91_DEIML|nr:GGDEF domain-containing protein [Deinococcus maricopensis]ADV68330.1 diguanylate cyclase [Deinococcus maricopensis DSM 21211]